MSDLCFSDSLGSSVVTITTFEESLPSVICGTSELPLDKSKKRHSKARMPMKGRPYVLMSRRWRYVVVRVDGYTVAADDFLGYGNCMPGMLGVGSLYKVAVVAVGAHNHAPMYSSCWSHALRWPQYPISGSLRQSQN